MGMMENVSGVVLGDERGRWGKVNIKGLLLEYLPSPGCALAD